MAVKILSKPINIHIDNIRKNIPAINTKIEVLF
jgi:hypothetical protein